MTNSGGAGSKTYSTGSKVLIEACRVVAVEIVSASILPRIHAIRLLLDVPGASSREIVPVHVHSAIGLLGDGVGVPRPPVVYVARLGRRGTGAGGKQKQAEQQTSHRGLLKVVLIVTLNSIL